MIELSLKGQKLAVHTPLVVAGTVDYLTIRIYRDSPEWEGLSLHIFFQRAGKTYELLTEGDFIGTDAHLNLSAGEWSVSVVGYEFDGDDMVEKVTTNTIGLTVAPAPPDAGESLPYTPPTAYEQIEAIARSVREDADAGKFDGEKGDKGDKGDAAFTVAIDSTITGDPGTDASVENVGTAGDQRWRITIPKGETGDSITVSSTVAEYQEGASGTTAPTGAWSTTVPSVTAGNYLWTRVTTTFSDGASAVSYSVSRMGIDGSGSVETVCNVSPDGNGNVALDADDVGALPDTYTPPVTSVNNKTGTVVIDNDDVNAERCVKVTATPTAAGWYRVASFDVPSNVQNGAWGFIFDINITRTYGFADNELHYIRLFGAYNNLQFLNEVSQSNSLGITKIRYTTSSAKAYIDIYSTLSTNGNAVTVDIVPHTNPTYIKSLKAESLQSVADAPSGETVSASYDFHWDISPTVKDISSSVSLNFTAVWKTATLHNGIVDLFIETYFDSYVADYEYTIGSIAAWYAPKSNLFFTGHTVDGSFNPRGVVTFTVYATGTMSVRINNTDGNFPILHASYSIF